MRGSVVFAGHLLPRLRFPLEFDYLDVTRYGDATRGGSITWKVSPGTAVAGRVVLIVDDILDSGNTVRLVREEISRRRPQSLRTCVLLRKQTKSALATPCEYVGFDIPDEFVVGYGLDYGDYYRNLPDIGTLKKEAM